MCTLEIQQKECLLFLEVVGFVGFDKTLTQLLRQKPMNGIYLHQALLAIKFMIRNLSLIFCHDASRSNLVTIALQSDLKISDKIL